jgi:hypothetical protein
MQHKRKTMLETIYEDDENILSESENDSAKSIEQPSRLPYYICCCMIIGCFLTMTLIIVVSLNPYILTNHSTHKKSEPILNIPINADGKLLMVMDIIEQLDIFSHQINERLDLQPNTITYLTSTIFDTLSNNNQNQSEILWIYSYLKYPQSCIDNNQCKENFNSKLKTSFMKLSNFLTTIDLDSYHDKLIQLDWCRFIENTTRAILVSLVSVTTINQSATELTNLGDRIHCENLDQNILLSRAIERVIEQDHQKLTNDFNHDHLTNKEEINMICSHSAYCSTYINHHHHLQKEPTHCSNNLDTRILLMWNSF